MPHATVDAAGERTSLQALQALENESTNGEKLVARILKILDSGNQNHFGREDWVARWVLKKLRNFEDADSVKLRATPEIWQLLSRVITVLPAPSFGRHLGAGEFVSILSRTLQENASMNRSSKVVDYSVLGEALHEISLNPQELHEKKYPQTTNSLKRKSHPAREHSSSKRAKRDHNEQNDQDFLDGFSLLQSVCACVKNLTYKSDDLAQSGDSFSAESLRVLLQADAEVACQFISNWMKAISNYMWNLVTQPEHTVEAAAQLAESPATNMLWVLRIWLERSDRSSVAHENVSEFTKTCAAAMSEFVPLSIALAATNEKPLVFEENLKHSTLLFVKSVILPARATYLKYKAEKLDPAPNVLGWQDALQLIYNDPPTGIGHVRDSKLTLATLVVLFRTAIYCTPLSGPKTLISESPWIEAVFTELMSCAELVLQDRPSEVKPRPAPELCETIEQLLRIANRHSLKFSKSTLRRLATNFGGVFEETAEKIHRPILSLIMQMDSAIFTTGQHERHTKKPSKDGDLSAAYFRSISKTCTIDIVDKVQEERSVSTFRIGVQEAGRLAYEFANQRNIKRFIQHWHAELEKHAQVDSSSLMAPRTLWETPSMAMIIQSLIGSSITEQQWLDIVRESSAYLIECTNIEDAKTSFDGSVLFADICITTLLLHAIEDDKVIDEISSLIQDMQGACLTALSMEHFSAGVKSKLWMLFSICFRLLLRSKIARTSTAQTDLHKIGTIILSAVPKSSSNLTLEKRMEANSAVAALCNMTSALVTQQILIKEMTTSVNELFERLLAIQFGQAQTKLLAYDVALLVAQNPYLFRSCSEEKLAQDVLLAIFNMSLDKADLSQTPWAILLRNIHLLDTRLLKQLQVAFQQILDSEFIASSRVLRVQVFEQLSTSFSNIDAALLPKRERITYIETALEILSTTTALAHGTLARLLSVILHFIKLSCDNISIASDLNNLSKAGKSLDRLLVDCDAETQANLYTIWEQICLACIRHHYQLQQDTELHGLHDLTIWSRSEKAALKLAKSLGSIYMTSDKANSSTSKELQSTLRKRANQVGQLLTDEVKGFSKSTESVKTDNIADFLEFLAVFDAASLIKIPDLDESILVLRDLDGVIQMSHLTLLHCCVVVCKLGLGRNVSVSHGLLSLFLSKRTTSPMNGLSKNLLRAIFKEMSKEALIDSMLLQLDICVGATNNDGSWALLLELVKVGASLDDTLDDDLVSRVLNLCCHQLRTGSGADDFYYACDIIEDILQSCGKQVEQNSIDELIHCLTKLVSLSSPNIPNSHGSDVYTRICTVSHTLISLYHKRWKGRFNLIVPLLQGALRCLFTPVLDISQVDKRLQHPAWLQNQALGQNSLQADQAERFTRLLTAICEPSASSVAQHHKKKGDTGHSLVDETKKARDYAGNYVPLVLGEFCHMQLVGGLPEGVRKALLPGLFACFNVMSEKSIKARMDGLDAGARVVFRSLWDEWNKFGRWTGG